MALILSCLDACIHERALRTHDEKKMLTRERRPARIKWQSIVWLGLGAVLALLLIALLLMVALNQDRVFDVIQGEYKDRAFIASTLFNANLVLLRFVVVLVGAGIAFAGLAVSFFTHERATEISGGGVHSAQLPRFRLVSHSPGIVAILVGATIIICALFAKTTSYYQGATTFEARPNAAEPKKEGLKQPKP